MAGWHLPAVCISPDAAPGSSGVLTGLREHDRVGTPLKEGPRQKLTAENGGDSIRKGRLTGTIASRLADFGRDRCRGTHGLKEAGFPSFAVREGARATGSGCESKHLPQLGIIQRGPKCLEDGLRCELKTTGRGSGEAGIHSAGDAFHVTSPLTTFTASSPPLALF